MCREVGHLTMMTTTIEVPYFGDALETTLACGGCGFRHADFMILSQKEPMRLTLVGQGPEALSARVIRSNSGTIRIPEIGFTAEPTPRSESFVSNVEGVFERARNILKTALEWFGEEPGKRELIESYLEAHQRILAGEMAFTLIIDDPFGNSAIVSEAVERRALTEEEAAELKSGMIILDMNDIAPE